MVFKRIFGLKSPTSGSTVIVIENANGDVRCLTRTSHSSNLSPSNVEIDQIMSLYWDLHWAYGYECLAAEEIMDRFDVDPDTTILTPYTDDEVKERMSRGSNSLMWQYMAVISFVLVLMFIRIWIYQSIPLV
jgi:hypothetical protein